MGPRFLANDPGRNRRTRARNPSRAKSDISERRNKKKKKKKHKEIKERKEGKKL
jgi:hypothetical protein